MLQQGSLVEMMREPLLFSLAHARVAQFVKWQEQNDTYMNSTEDLRQVLTVVSLVTGIPEGHIFTHRRGQQYYDARWIAVQLLSDLGYYPSQIVNLVGGTLRNVNKILAAVRERKGTTWRIFLSKLELCRNAMGTIRPACRLLWNTSELSSSRSSDLKWSSPRKARSSSSSI